MRRKSEEEEEFFILGRGITWESFQKEEKMEELKGKLKKSRITEEQRGGYR